MQEKRNLRLLITLITLLLITTGVFFISGRKQTPVVDKKLFAVDDLKSIDRVLLESKSGNVELQYNGSRWRVNNQYDADRDMIDVLFATLEQAEPKRPVASALADSVGKALQTDGVNVSLFIGDKLQQNFLAGGNDVKTQAFFRRADEPTSYLMVIPGYRVYVSGIFELNEGGWRDKYVFGFNWRNFQGMEITFPAYPKDDFRIAQDKDYFGIPGITQVDTTRLNNFIDAISLLTVDEYVISNPVTDSLKKLPPTMTIRVKDIANREYALHLFLAPGQKTSVTGLLNDRDGVRFDSRKIEPILKPREFFKQK
ncbi:MAG: DUF4340 domain-containing protein [Cyclobacteriaceae bacterium]|nr:DUF4340 domain-containing protein [Cyclobacteriaceae bacterium]